MISMFMAGTMDDAANIAAINRYIMNEPVRTKEAGKVRDKWLKWHDNLGWYSREFPSVEVYDQARNLKNEFNLANAPTPAEKAQVKQIMQTGVTSEEMRGETKRTTAEGGYLAPEIDESEPWLPAKTKAVLGVGALIIGGVWALKKIYVDPWLAFAPKRR